MSSFLKDNKFKSEASDNYKTNCTQSEFTGDDSLIDRLSDSFNGSSSMFEGNSFVLKENSHSLNSTNNITFADNVFRKPQRKDQNLAYSISNRFPPKIRKQVEAIIDYYENQLQSQRQLFWRMTQKSKTQKHQALALARLQKQNIQSPETTEKDKRINQLQDKLLQKDKKITNLTKEITTLMVKCTKLNKELSSPNKSIKSSRVFDSIKLQQ